MWPPWPTVQRSWWRFRGSSRSSTGCLTGRSMPAGKHAGRTRTARKIISAPVTMWEREQVRANATRAGLTVADWIRRMTCGPNALDPDIVIDAIEAIWGMTYKPELAPNVRDHLNDLARRLRAVYPKR